MILLSLLKCLMIFKAGDGELGEKEEDNLVPLYVQVDGLEGLRNLEQLYLNHNSIKELEPSSFSGLQKLQILHMGDNALKTLVHLGSLLALVSLDMTSNLLTPSRLGGLSSIDNLSPLPNLAKLWLTNNPVHFVLSPICFPAHRICQRT
jgi:Leucine-rich repeat (LRR) protein